MLLVLFLAISLSMDAFSLSLAYGTIINNKRDIFLLAFTVGIFHFFMPLFGMILGSKIFSLLSIASDYLVCAILVIVGIQMIIESFKCENIKSLKGLEILLFALAVSIDSFSVGLTLQSIYNNYIVSCILFSFTSFLFTLIGLLLGNKIKKSIGFLSTIIGGFFLIVIGICFLL